MEQRLPWSTEKSYAGACGAAALWEQIQLLQWSIMEQLLSWSIESSYAGAYGAAALWEQIHCSTCSSRAALCAPGKPMLDLSAPVEQLYVLTG